MRRYPAFDGCKKGIDHLFVERGKRVQKRLRNQFKKWLDILGLNTQKSSHKVLAHSHLGWILSEMGKRVLMIDADSQCNLTGLCLSLAGTEDIEEFYNYSGIDNIKTSLEPVFEGLPKRLEPAKCFEFSNREDLYLLLGHTGFTELDVTIGIAQELKRSLRKTQNIPGVINYLINITSREYGFDYVLIDMSPSVSATNANLLMQSDYFIIPCSPDYFCNMAIHSLALVLPEWKNTYDNIRRHQIFQNAEYRFSNTLPKFIGTILQRYRPKNGVPAISFQSCIGKINHNVATNLVPTLREHGMLINEEMFGTTRIDGGPYNLVNISDFNSLIAQSQKLQHSCFCSVRRTI
ncbi:ParA family protein [Aeribacillus sp. FSL M8-0254]|uniref:ParA family protein n=1 Tax=Aeribacillus sp. FSL M8-0254 TaxID=2954577 RepID=UPI0030F8A249